MPGYFHAVFSGKLENLSYAALMRWRNELWNRDHKPEHRVRLLELYTKHALRLEVSPLLDDAMAMDRMLEVLRVIEYRRLAASPLAWPDIVRLSEGLFERHIWCGTRADRRRFAAAARAIREFLSGEEVEEYAEAFGDE